MLSLRSPRMLSVIRLGALGLSDKEIATELDLSACTVKEYFSDLRFHLGSFNRTALPGIALCLGILTVRELKAPAEKLLAGR